MIFSILTLFPGIFSSPLKESILGKAAEKGLVSFNIINIRDFADDPHRCCDDTPYGGGPGMVMKVEPIYRAIQHVTEVHGRAKFVLLTPQGRPFDQFTAERFARSPHICLICGRYEGVDERVLDHVDEEISVGDYVTSGGEFPALVLIDAVSRFVPGVLGNDESVFAESFREPLLEYPQYTRPENFMGAAVPPVLLSGNHEEIRKWRRKEAIRKTVLKRSDLLNRFQAGEEDRKFMREVMEEFPE
ncbi:MAG: tRNA (guanosine(37)-N1)-methyltransferase TrmD [Syntrophorhabdaceae bacterium]|nr:tRNA (guanosine(37)-N1)-methyltransferase TrmD [Syntrophorhabdaceae bacterium]HBL23227.1 tRNA (guanosine(37)-N1)-methyltransferase TrmD [Deltaproteobacteria bacterium]